MLQELGKVENSKGSNSWGVVTKELEVAEPWGMKPTPPPHLSLKGRRQKFLGGRRDPSQHACYFTLMQQHKECERWLPQIPKHVYFWSFPILTLLGLHQFLVLAILCPFSLHLVNSYSYLKVQLKCTTFLNSPMVSNNPVLMLLLEHIYAFGLFTSSTAALMPTLHLLGFYYLLGTKHLKCVI